MRGKQFKLKAVAKVLLLVVFLIFQNAAVFSSPVYADNPSQGAYSAPKPTVKKKATKKPAAKKKVTKKATKSTKKKTSSKKKTTSKTNLTSIKQKQLEARDKRDSKKSTPAKTSTKKTTTTKTKKKSTTSATKFSGNKNKYTQLEKKDAAANKAAEKAAAEKKKQQALLDSENKRMMSKNATAVANQKKAAQKKKAEKAAAEKRQKALLESENKRMMSKNATAVNNQKKADQKKQALLDSEDKRVASKNATAVANQKKADQKRKAEKAASQKRLYEQTMKDVEKRRSLANALAKEAEDNARTEYDKEHGKGSYDKKQKKDAAAAAKTAKKAAAKIEKEYDSAPGHKKGDYDKKIAAEKKAKEAKERKDYDAVYGRGSYDKTKKKQAEQIKKGSAYDIYHKNNDGKVISIRQPSATKVAVRKVEGSVAGSQTATATVAANQSGNQGGIWNSIKNSSFGQGTAKVLGVVGKAIDYPRGILAAASYGVSDYLGRGYSYVTGSLDYNQIKQSEQGLKDQLAREKKDLENLQKQQKAGKTLTQTQKNYLKYLTNGKTQESGKKLTQNSFQKGWEMVGAGADPTNFSKIADDGYFGGKKVIQKNAGVSMAYGIAVTIATDPLNLLAGGAGGAAGKAEKLAKASDGAVKVIEVGTKGSQGFAEAAKVAEALEDGEKAVVVMQKTSGMGKYVSKIPFVGRGNTATVVVEGSSQALDLIGGIAKGSVRDSGGAIKYLDEAIKASEAAGKVVTKGELAAVQNNGKVMKGLYKAVSEGQAAEKAASAAEAASKAANKYGKSSTAYKAAIRTSREAEATLLSMKSAAAENVGEKAAVMLKQAGNGMARTPYMVSDAGKAIASGSKSIATRTRNFFTEVSGPGRAAELAAETKSVVGSSSKTALEVAEKAVDSKMASLEKALKAGDVDAIDAARLALEKAQDLQQGLSQGNKLSALEMANLDKTHAELLLEQAKASGTKEAVASAEKALAKAESKIATIEKGDALAAKSARYKEASDDIARVQEEIGTKNAKLTDAEAKLSEYESSLPKSGRTKSQNAKLNKLKNEVASFNREIGNLTNKENALKKVLAENKVNTGSVVWNNVKSLGSRVADGFGKARDSVVARFQRTATTATKAAEEETKVAKASASLDELRSATASKIDEAMADIEHYKKIGNPEAAEEARKLLGRYQDIQYELDKATDGAEAVAAAEKSLHEATEGAAKAKVTLAEAEKAGDAERVAAATDDVAKAEKEVVQAKGVKEAVKDAKAEKKVVDAAAEVGDDATKAAIKAKRQAILEKEKEIQELNKQRFNFSEGSDELNALEKQLKTKYAELRDLKGSKAAVVEAAKATEASEKASALSKAGKKVSDTFTDISDSIKSTWKSIFNNSDEAKLLAQQTKAERAAAASARAEKEAELSGELARAKSALESSAKEAERLAQRGLDILAESQAETKPLATRIQDAREVLESSFGQGGYQRVGVNRRIVMTEENSSTTLKSISSILTNETRESGKAFGTAESRILHIKRDLADVSWVGDLHGDYEATLKAIAQSGVIDDPKKTIVFLGDYLDRGVEDMETFQAVLKLKEKYPEQVFLLRGNHEDFTLATQRWQSSKAAIQAYYGQAGVLEHQAMFDRMPLGIVIDDIDGGGRAFGVHGFTPKANGGNISLAELATADDSIAKELTWLDPENVDGLSDFVDRGVGLKPVSVDETRAFLDKNDITYVVRGHEQGPNQLKDSSVVERLQGLLGSDASGNERKVFNVFNNSNHYKLSGTSSFEVYDAVKSTNGIGKSKLDIVRDAFAKASSERAAAEGAFADAKAALSSHRSETFWSGAKDAVANFFDSVKARVPKLDASVAEALSASADDGFIDLTPSENGILSKITDYFAAKKQAQAAEAAAKLHGDDLEKVSEAVSAVAKDKGVDIAALDGLAADKQALAKIASEGGYKDADALYAAVADYAEGIKYNKPVVTLPDQGDDTVRLVFGSNNTNLVEGYAERGITAGGGSKLAKYESEATLRGLGKEANVVVVDIPQSEAAKYFATLADGTVDFSRRLKVAIPAEYVTVVKSDFVTVAKQFGSLSKASQRVALATTGSKITKSIEYTAKAAKTAEEVGKSNSIAKGLGGALAEAAKQKLLANDQNGILWGWLGTNAITRTIYALNYQNFNQNVVNNDALEFYKNAVEAANYDSNEVLVGAAAATATAEDNTDNKDSSTKDGDTKDNDDSPSGDGDAGDSPDSSAGTTGSTGGTSTSGAAKSGSGTSTGVDKKNTGNGKLSQDDDGTVSTDFEGNVRYTSPTKNSSQSYYIISRTVAPVQVSGAAFNGTIPMLSVLTKSAGRLTPNTKVQVELARGDASGVTFNTAEMVSDSNGVAQIPLIGTKAGVYGFRVKVNGEYLAGVGNVVFTQATIASSNPLFPMLNFNILAFIKSILPIAI